MEYYSAIRKEETWPFVTTWVDLENIMLSEISQMESQEPYDFTYMWDTKLKATNEQTRQTKNNSQTHTTVGWLAEGKVVCMCGGRV